MSKSLRSRVPVSKSNKSGSPYGLLINIDEVGNAKGRNTHRNYSIVASKIIDRWAFQDVVQRIGIENNIEKELSFNGNKNLAVEILDAVSDYVSEVVYVYAYRPEGYEFVLNPKTIHLKLLENLAKDLNLETGEDVLIFVDSNDDLVTETQVKNAINPRGLRNITCLVLPSRYFFELQGHDFITGGIGHELNTGDSSYSDVLRKHGKKLKGRKIEFELRRLDNE